VKPVLDSRCVVCHACYNAACQLKLGSYEGAARGGSKKAVYDAKRLTDEEPTRLFTDAQTTAQWRDKGFHSVTASPDAANDSIMAYLLDAKRRRPEPEGRYLAEADDLTCAADGGEARSFVAKHPGRGMPFGFPALSADEHDLLTIWLQQGAPGPTPEEQRRLTTPSPAAAAEIARWEAFLNRDDAKHAMTARYLYEHFFLAHLRFPATGTGEFFSLVRSTTPPGQPAAPIASRRPYDDPGADAFYYRFEKIHSTIVLKTHMVVDFDDRRLARYRELFIDGAWLEEPHRMPYEDRESANPFLTYAQIPPAVRYAFLLDHSEYIVQSFMQGPVCKGQIALNVINDHFWVMFLDPAADLTVRHPEFLAEQSGNLRLPTERGSSMSVLSAFSNEYRERYASYYAAKKALYERVAPEGPGLDAIWPGRRPEDAPLLTIYRHFDSASVMRGAVGDLPRTIWVIDYAQFERIYYALVAGFDVFGNVSHQANVRRYMDYLRMEGEANFLKFLPPETRTPTMASWYLGDNAVQDVLQHGILARLPTRVPYATDDPKRELIERVVNERLLEGIGIGFDPVNYHPAGEVAAMPRSFATSADLRDGLRAINAPGTGFIRHITSSEANVIYVRVRGLEGPFRFFSIVINRWHDNVNSLFFESQRLDPSRDTIDFIPGAVGAYPNYFFDLRVEDVPEFLDMLVNFDGSPAYLAKVDRFGINRSEPEFWSVYDWFQRESLAEDPVTGGLFDLNRYYSEARADLQ
jgi:hypothetical protein